MTKRLVRILDFFVILTILISQLGLMSDALTKASAAPAQDNISTNPSFAGVTISNVRIGRGGNVAYMSPGSIFSLSMD